MLKAAKKVKKLLTRKKTKRKKTSYYEQFAHLPPTSTSTLPFHCCCSCCSYQAPSVQPSAPPLPPWLEWEAVFAEFPGSANPTETQVPLPAQEVAVETETNSTTTLASSYQQYTVPNPVYDAPPLETGRRERCAGFYGCVNKLGDRVIGCFCSCLQIGQEREIMM